MLKYQASIEIAGLVFQFETNQPHHLKWIKEQCRRYTVDKNPDVKISLYSKVKIFPHGRRLFNAPYSVHGDIDKTLDFEVYSRNDYIPLGDLLRSLATAILIRRGGVLLHSCGVVMNGSAYCLAGPSGSGKTTLAKLIDNGCTLLSDETTAVIRNHKGYFACATPFFGDFGGITSNNKAKLKGILFLKQAGNFGHRKLKAHFTNAKLIQNMFLPGRDLHDNIESIFDIASDINKSTPCYELDFLPNRQIWKYIEEKISPGA